MTMGDRWAGPTSTYPHLTNDLPRPDKRSTRPSADSARSGSVRAPAGRRLGTGTGDQTSPPGATTGRGAGRRAELLDAADLAAAAAAVVLAPDGGARAGWALCPARGMYV